MVVRHRADLGDHGPRSFLGAERDLPAGGGRGATPARCSARGRVRRQVGDDRRTDGDLEGRLPLQRGRHLRAGRRTLGQPGRQGPAQPERGMGRRRPGRRLAHPPDLRRPPGSVVVCAGAVREHDRRRGPRPRGRPRRRRRRGSQRRSARHRSRRSHLSRHRGLPAGLWPCRRRLRRGVDRGAALGRLPGRGLRIAAVDDDRSHRCGAARGLRVA